MTGEGLWTFWRQWKPATFDAVSDGWSPLRWCLFADPLHGYSGREITIEAVLANEEVLKPGEYPVRFRGAGMPRVGGVPEHGVEGCGCGVRRGGAGGEGQEVNSEP